MLVGALAALICVLALARLATGPWYALYTPWAMQLLPQWPTAWETIYYANHLPTFLGDGPIAGWIAPVQYRTLLNLYLAALVTGWTSNAYAGLAFADVLVWIAGCVAGYYAMLRLGAPPSAATLGAFLTAVSPILISNMWRHDLHAANFATMPIGLWALLVLLDEERRPLRLGLGLGLVFLLLSLSYQYQWVLIPVAVGLARSRAQLPWRSAGVALAVSLVVFVFATLLIRAGIDVVGLSSRGPESTAVQEPDRLLLTRLTDPGGWTALLPQRTHLEMTLQAYHPLVLVAGVLGLARLGGSAALAGLIASAASLWAITLYPAPWTAMSAYPLVYLGAGVLCRDAGRLVIRPLAQSATSRWVALLVAAALALALASLTNGDLWGDYRFLLTWWRLYYPQFVF